MIFFNKEKEMANIISKEFIFEKEYHLNTKFHLCINLYRFNNEKKKS